MPSVGSFGLHGSPEVGVRPFLHVHGWQSERFMKAVRSAMDQAGIDSSRYAGHSFRIGAATTAAQWGVQDSLIKTLGRWKSAAYMVYICTPQETVCAVTGTLAGLPNQYCEIL